LLRSEHARLVEGSVRGLATLASSLTLVLAAAACSSAADSSAPGDAGVHPDAGDSGLRDDAGEPGDIADELRAIEDFIAVTELPSASGLRHFELRLQQPLDHERPSETFSHRIWLLFRDYDAPTVLVELGYGMSGENWEYPLTSLLGANQVTVEHRFFEESLPRTADWSTLTFRQAAADSHHIIETLSPLLRGGWAGHGYSKGGLSVMLHHHFYPDDYRVIAPFVAPIHVDQQDQRFVPCIRDAMPTDCRQAQIAHQRHAIRQAEAMATALETSSGITMPDDRLRDAIIDEIVRAGWYFWQFFGIDPATGAPNGGCSALPGDDLDIDALLALYRVEPYWLVNAHSPSPSIDGYRYQEMAQIGSSGFYLGDVEDVLPPGYVLGTAYDAVVARPWGEDPVYDPSESRQALEWYATTAENTLAVYGGTDPNTCGAIEVSAASSRVYVVPGGNHWVSYTDLVPADRDDFIDRIRSYFPAR
jgi:hypothetical protein